MEKRKRGNIIEVKYIKSPLNYTGGKFKLLSQIIPLFPQNINTLSICVGELPEDFDPFDV